MTRRKKIVMTPKLAEERDEIRAGAASSHCVARTVEDAVIREALFSPERLRPVEIQIDGFHPNIAMIVCQALADAGFEARLYNGGDDCVQNTYIAVHQVADARRSMWPPRTETVEFWPQLSGPRSSQIHPKVTIFPPTRTRSSGPPKTTLFEASRFWPTPRAMEKS